MSRTVSFLLTIPIIVWVNGDQCISVGDKLPDYEICDSARRCSCAQSTCVSGICIDESSIASYLIDSTSRSPNNVYITFSLWDKNCNPYVRPPAYFNATLRLMEKSASAQNFRDVSALESFYGMTRNTAGTSLARVLLLVDLSGSIQKSIETLRGAVLAFLRAIIDQPDARQNIETAVYGFWGGADLVDLSFGGGFSKNYNALVTTIQSVSHLLC